MPHLVTQRVMVGTAMMFHAPPRGPRIRDGCLHDVPWLDALQGFVFMSAIFQIVLQNIEAGAVALLWGLA